MTETTHYLKLPYIAAAQSQKHVTHNEAILVLDTITQLSVVSKNLAEPPVAPTPVARYIVATGSTGAWAGHDTDVACWQDQSWFFYPPQTGWLAWVHEDSMLVVWDGTAWQTVSGNSAGGGGSPVINPTPLVGVNATANATNRLTVSSPATLLNHEGNDHQLKINKNSTVDTASLLYQTNYAGHAEMGLTGDDDFHFKVSADGNVWKDAILIDKSTGIVSFPHTVTSGSAGGREVLTADRTYYVRTDGNDNNTGLGNSSATAFLTIQHAINVIYGTLDLFGFNVTIQLANGTYSENIKVHFPQIGGGNITLRGDETTPSNVTINSTAGTTIDVSNIGTVIYIAGIKTTTAGFACWSCTNGGLIKSSGHNEFGTAPSAHMFIWGGSLELSHLVTVSGDCPGTHIITGLLGKSSLQTASWNFVGNITFGTFVQSTGNALVYTYGNNFSGTVSGKRFDVSANGTIITNSGGNISVFPGTSAGTTASGGQYS